MENTQLGWLTCVQFMVVGCWSYLHISALSHIYILQHADIIHACFHSTQPHCTVGRRLYWAWGHRKNICCQKIFGNSFSFQATEMVLNSKCGKIQSEIQIWPDQVVAASWTRVWSPWKWENMPIQLRSAMTPLWPTVHIMLYLYCTVP